MKTWNDAMARRVRAVLLLSCALLCPVGPVQAADELTVEARKAGSAVAIEAYATVTAPYDLIWSTLTDYDHLSEFIPGMSSSRVVRREGPVAIVEQTGEAGFLIFSYGIDVVVESVEFPPERLEIHVRSGNLKQLDGAYRLEPGTEPGAWRLSWSGLIEPSLPVPTFLSVRLIRRNVQSQFSGMVAEIERRHAVSAMAAVVSSGSSVATQQ